MAYTKLTYAERKEKVAKELEELETSLAEHGKADSLYQESLDIYSNMLSMKHTYSLNNILLASIMGLKQGIEVRHLGSFAYWKSVSAKINKIKGTKLWYGIKKAQKGLTILVPKHASYKEDDKDGNEVKKLRLVGFTTGKTFDISQTEIDPKMLEEIYPKPLEGLTREAKYEALLEAVMSMGYTIEWEDLGEASHGGYIQPDCKRIVINSKGSKDHQLKVLFHELAHGELGHGIGGAHGIEDKNRAAFEIQAESVAYILCKMADFDTSDYSFKYIKNWGSNDLAFIKECTSKAQKLVVKIVEKLEDKGILSLTA